MGKAWSDYMAKNAKREYEEGDPIKIIDQLRAELAALKEEQIATLTELQSFREHATALDAHIERLGKALKPFADRIKQYPPWMWEAMVEREKQGIITGGFRVGGEAVTHMPAMLLVQAEEVLADTPTQSLSAHDEEVKAAVLREVANKFEATEIDAETREPSESYDCGYKDGQYSAVSRMLAEANRIEKGEK